NWKVIQNLLDNRFKEKGMDDANWWNTQAWDVYEKCDDPALIESAITWIHAVCEKDRDYNYLDTYAALLFKAGKLQEAEAKAKEAIEVGKAAGNKVEGTEKLLEKIQEALQKKETPSR
ncbi:MAG: hypothetical protein LPK45_10755, partial [Bacteroidota bacterium]|nr:hypothetical protein [Bacteroidota bacterium]MDX5431580.1 hypothetical protein [Bacteroidota bacterium]MDX5470300.1 hypothetical protein [Bacteroidota bacterium]